MEKKEGEKGNEVMEQVFDRSLFSPVRISLLPFSQQFAETVSHCVILNSSRCHSEGAKRLKNLSFRVNSVKDLKSLESKILRYAQNDNSGS
jgi:hypothetical protein